VSDRQTVITVPSLVRAGDLIVVGYDDATRKGYIEIPYVRTLTDVSEAELWKRAEASNIEVARARVRAGMEFVSIGDCRVESERAWVTGYLERLNDERRARCDLGRDQLGAIVRVATGWPIFDMRSPLINGQGR
jgi:hypothetical protein